MGIAFLLILKLMCAEIYDRKKNTKKKIKTNLCLWESLLS